MLFLLQLYVDVDVPVTVSYYWTQQGGCGEGLEPEGQLFQSKDWAPRVDS